MLPNVPFNKISIYRDWIFALIPIFPVKEIKNVLTTHFPRSLVCNTFFFSFFPVNLSPVCNTNIGGADEVLFCLRWRSLLLACLYKCLVSWEWRLLAYSWFISCSTVKTRRKKKRAFTDDNKNPCIRCCNVYKSDSTTSLTIYSTFSLLFLPS